VTDEELDAAIRTVSAVHTRRRPITPTSEDWCDECCVDWPCDYERVVAAALEERLRSAQLTEALGRIGYRVLEGSFTRPDGTVSPFYLERAAGISPQEAQQ
jgi:hypothetical protein